MTGRLVSFVTGFFALLVVAFLGAMAMSVVADQAGWGSLDASVGPLSFVALTSTASQSSFALGPGVVLAALALAGLNTVAGIVLSRKRHPAIS